MVERVTLEPEVQEVLSHIDNGEDFLLSGGAGSGKTYSLVRLIGQILREEPRSRIACVTYTNSAVKEIEERISADRLFVSTIHDFLWDCIGHFQAELKAALIALVNDPESKIKNPEDSPITDSYFNAPFNGIRYREYLSLKNGIVSHDEVLILANYIFKTHPKICKILQDRFQYILIDEYQDTNPTVVEIFLVHLRVVGKNNVIGFFGDSMQSIYDDGVGDLSCYVANGIVKEVKKTQNRRNPIAVIDLANKLRTDGIIQVPSGDVNAPNMFGGSVKNGNVKFFHSVNNETSSVLAALGWDCESTGTTKILNLTNNQIAIMAGFSELMAIYDKDPVIGLKSDILKKIKQNRDSGKPSVYIAEDDSFDQVVDKFNLKRKTGVTRKEEILANSASAELYDKLKNLPFNQVRKIYLDKDSLIDDKKQDPEDESKKGSKRDALIKHLYKIQEYIALYTSGEYNEFLRRTEYQILSVEDKARLKVLIEDLSNGAGGRTIGEVIDMADEFGICKIDDKLTGFIGHSEYVYERVRNVRFSEFQQLFAYVEGYTPFSTQHKTKGREFENVLVVLDNGGWNNYNFSGLFEGTNVDTVKLRTEKIFYVCCTRAKENLALFFHDPSDETKSKATEWFGSENVIEI